MRLTTQSRVCGSWPAVSAAVKTDRIPGSLTDYRGRVPLRRSAGRRNRLDQPLRGGCGEQGQRHFLRPIVSDPVQEGISLR